VKMSHLVEEFLGFDSMEAFVVGPLQDGNDNELVEQASWSMFSFFARWEDCQAGCRRPRGAHRISTRSRSAG
jgi:hypothetical protein